LLPFYYGKVIWLIKEVVTGMEDIGWLIIIVLIIVVFAFIKRFGFVVGIVLLIVVGVVLAGLFWDIVAGLFLFSLF
jgi:hypothetical protein